MRKLPSTITFTDNFWRIPVSTTCHVSNQQVAEVVLFLFSKCTDAGVEDVVTFLNSWLSYMEPFTWGGIETGGNSFLYIRWQGNAVISLVRKS